jgi:AcrR family transcriptional regulator
VSGSERDSREPGRTTPPLPPGLDLLWGRRERGRRGPKPELSTEAIVEAAVRVADEEGLEAVSMARVANELGFTTMSLYRHVASKEELLQLMWNASAHGAQDLILEGTDWRTRLRNWAVIQRDMLDRHPWITQMPMAAPPLAPNSLTFVERGLETMDGTAMADADKLRVIGLISSYTLSEARMAHDAARASAATTGAAGEGPTNPPWTFDGLLRELVDERDYPRLHRIAWSDRNGGDDSGSEEWEEFLFGLNRILDGVAALIAQQSRRPRDRRSRSSGRASDPPGDS